MQDKYTNAPDAYRLALSKAFYSTDENGALVKSWDQIFAKITMSKLSITGELKVHHWNIPNHPKTPQTTPIPH